MNTFLTKIDRRFRRRVGWIGIVLAALAIACEADAWVYAKWVADGDTIIIDDGRRVRYIGIDAPEIDYENHRAAPMGYAAQSKNRQLVEGRQLKLEYDREKKDHYGRTLAYVHRSDGLFVNLELLKQGYAYVLSRCPNTSKAGLLLSAQREAMRDGKGIWRLLRKDEKPSHAYLGNQRSKRFHVHDCVAGNRMSAKHRIGLENQWAAFWSGYAPAKGCIQFPTR